LARGWAISGIDDRTREAANAAADEAGMPVGAWVERALRRALEAKAEPEPAQPRGVEPGELEAMVRRVVAEELRPVKEALARPGTTAAPPSPADGSPVRLMRERRRQRRR
jgi:localization factor PodJL